MARPTDHEMFERGVAFDDQTTNRQVYQEGKGERYDRHVPQDSNLLRGVGAFASETVNRADYQGGAGEE
jgi:hypothetical protein